MIVEVIVFLIVEVAVVVEDDLLQFTTTIAKVLVDDGFLIDEGQSATIFVSFFGLFRGNGLET